MCGWSSGKINGVDANLDIGYYGGSIEIGDFKYGVGDYENGSKSELIAFFEKFDKIKIIEMLADLIENAEEG